eukprot:gene5793-biopygen5731
MKPLVYNRSAVCMAAWGDTPRTLLAILSISTVFSAPGRDFASRFVSTFVTFAFPLHPSRINRATPRSNSRFRSQSGRMDTPLFTTVGQIRQKVSGLKLWIRSWRWTTKPRVGVWQGPYDTTEASRLPYLLWKYFVWKRVKATPTFKSSSCLASTALLWFSSGLMRLFIACTSSVFVMAENFARQILSQPRMLSFTQSRTSKQMFSPSLSQSSQRTMSVQPLASCFK